MNLDLRKEEIAAEARKALRGTQGEDILETGNKYGEISEETNESKKEAGQLMPKFADMVAYIQLKVRVLEVKEIESMGRLYTVHDRCLKHCHRKQLSTSLLSF